MCLIRVCSHFTEPFSLLRWLSSTAELVNLGGLRQHTENRWFITLPPTPPTKKLISNTDTNNVSVYHDVMTSFCEFKALFALTLITSGESHK